MFPQDLWEHTLQQAFWDKPKLALWEHLLHVLGHVIFLWEWQAFDKFFDDDYVGTQTWLALTVLPQYFT